MCRCLNPCFCFPGPAEIGVCIMSMVHPLYITAAFILGLALGYDTILIVFCADRFSYPIPLHYRVLQALIFVWYTVTFMVEVGLREFLYRTIEMVTATKIQRCYVWTRVRVVQIAVGIPLSTLYLYLNHGALAITLYCVGWVYHLYYTWVVYYYIKLLEKPETVQPTIETNQFTIAIDPGVPLSTLNSNPNSKSSAK